ncbi:MAG: hypothetical protein IKE91_03000 [Clostridia bacterium]|nr:hypothetical protein [Clostridia bacterium]
MGLFSSKKIVSNPNNQNKKSENPAQMKEEVRLKIKDLTIAINREDNKNKKIVEIQSKLEDVIPELERVKECYTDGRDSFSQNYISDTATKQLSKFDASIEYTEKAEKEIHKALQEINIKLKDSNRKISEMTASKEYYIKVMEALV